MRLVGRSIPSYPYSNSRFQFFSQPPPLNAFRWGCLGRREENCSKTRALIGSKALCLRSPFNDCLKGWDVKTSRKWGARMIPFCSAPYTNMANMSISNTKSRFSLSKLAVVHPLSSSLQSNRPRLYRNFERRLRKEDWIEPHVQIPPFSLDSNLSAPLLNYDVFSINLAIQIAERIDAT